MYLCQVGHIWLSSYFCLDFKRQMHHLSVNKQNPDDAAFQIYRLLHDKKVGTKNIDNNPLQSAAIVITR